MKTVLLPVALLVALVGCSEALKPAQPESKLYFGPIPLPLIPPASVCVAPLGCVMFNIMCPPCYKPGGGGSGSGTCSAARPGVPTDIVTQRQAALANGNEYRRKHGAAPLTVDPALEAEAQQYAEYLASTKQFLHSQPAGRYGENLAKIPCSSTNPPATIAGANTAWYGEKPNYCPAGGAVDTKVAVAGHFTQLVWKGSQKVGYGAAVGPDGYLVVVARYTPPGNVAGAAAAQQNIQCQEVP